MLRKATLRAMAVTSLVIIAVAGSAQPGTQVHGPNDALFKSTILKSADSTEIHGLKTFASAGVGSVLARHGKTSPQYYKMIDSLAKIVFTHPGDDSAGLKFATDWVGTPNMGLRRPNYVIIHYTANSSCDETLKYFASPGGREASAHYVICKDGTIHHMLNDLLRSHHAGDSKWGNNTDLNSSSIGIEIVNSGKEPYTEEQIISLTGLLERLKTEYKIPTANFIGHGDIAPTRKVDPGTQFPWKDLSEKGFGLWWDDSTKVEVPIHFDYLMGLRIIGYDISSPSSAVAAFKRHFMGENSSTMNNDVRKVIYMVYRKFE